MKLEEAFLFERFKREHEAMSDSFIEQIKELAEKFEKSSAGEAYKVEVQRLKKLHKPAPSLEDHMLESYNGRDGIQFSLKEIFEFFQGLRACAETQVIV